MNALIETVSTIFKERYGASLTIESKNERAYQQPQFLGRWHSPFVYSRTLRQVSFPIFNSKQQLQAIATASPVDNKDAIVFDEMAQFIQLTIAEHIELNEQKEIVEQQQIALETLYNDQNKIVQLKTRKDKNKPMQFQYKKIESKRQPDLRPIWISGKNDNFNAHIAFSVHDWVSNWAFINAKEIPDLIWKDPHSWTHFPNITIFVPNVATLSASQLTKLKDNLATLRKIKDVKPLVIISSPLELSSELEELKREFKHYRSNQKVTARVQAHFLLYHHRDNESATHRCEKTNGLFFLPFSPKPNNFH